MKILTSSYSTSSLFSRGFCFYSNVNGTFFRSDRDYSSLALRVNQNSNSIQELFGTQKMESPYIVPLINIASQLYSGVSSICEAFLTVRNRDSRKFGDVYRAGSIMPSFGITYNSLLIFVQGCYAPVYHYGALRDRLELVGGVQIELLIIATYSYAAFWILQHIMGFTLSNSTLSLIKLIGGNNIPLIRMHEIYYKLIFAEFEDGKMNGGRMGEMSTIGYNIKPTITYERWHDPHASVNDIVDRILDLVMLIDNRLDRLQASSVVKSLVDGRPDDHSTTGITGTKLVNLQKFVGNLNLRNGGGNIAKVLTSNVITDLNPLAIKYVLEGFHTVLNMAHIPFRFAKDVHAEQLTLSEFSYAFPVICNNPNTDPSRMKLFVDKSINIKASKFIAYGWTSILGSSISIKCKAIDGDKTFQTRFNGLLKKIDSKFISPYAGLFREAFIMITGVVPQTLDTRVDGVTAAVNTYKPRTDVRYVAELTTGFSTVPVEKSIISNGYKRNTITSGTDLFAGAISLDEIRGSKPSQPSGTNTGVSKTGKSVSSVSKGNVTSTSATSATGQPLMQSAFKKQNDPAVVSSGGEGVTILISDTGEESISKGIESADLGTSSGGGSNDGGLGSDDGSPNGSGLDALSSKKQNKYSVNSSLRGFSNVGNFIGSTLISSKLKLSAQCKLSKMSMKNSDESSVVNESNENDSKVKFIDLVSSGAFVRDMKYRFDILISDSSRRNYYSNLISKLIRECVIVPLHSKSFRDRSYKFYLGEGTCTGKLINISKQSKLLDIDFIRSIIPKSLGYKQVEWSLDKGQTEKKVDYVGLTYLIVNGVRFILEFDVNKNIRTISTRQSKKRIKQILVLVRTMNEELSEQANLIRLNFTKQEGFETYTWEMNDESLVILKVWNYSFTEKEVQDGLIEKTISYDIGISILDRTSHLYAE